MADRQGFLRRAGSDLTDWATSIWNVDAYKVRQHFRMMRENPEYNRFWDMLLRERGYKNAKTGSTKTAWVGGTATADSEISGDRIALINRSRELARDDAVGGGILNTFVSEVIGSGFTPEAMTGDSDKNDAIEEVFRERCDYLFPQEDLDFIDHQSLVYRRRLEDGDVLIKKAVSGNEPLWFELFESDRLATPTQVERDKDIRDGVERDNAGRVVAYHVMSAPPGPKVTLKDILNASKFKRYPKEIINHVKHVNRVGQTRGVPLLHAVLQDLRDLDLLTVASLKRLQLAACLAVFIESEDSLENMMDATAKEYGYQLDQALEPGMIFKLYPKEKMSSFVPNYPVPELFPFIQSIAQRVGAGIGICWQSVLRDFSKSNYSSARVNILKDNKTYQAEQTWFARNVLSWEWYAVLDDMRARGDSRLRGLTDAELKAVRWLPTGSDWVDPAKESEGWEKKLAMGVTSRQRIAAGLNGADARDILEENLMYEKWETELREKLGVPKPEPVQSENTGDNEDDKEDS